MRKRGTHLVATGSRSRQKIEADLDKLVANILPDLMESDPMRYLHLFPALGIERGPLDENGRPLSLVINEPGLKRLLELSASDPVAYDLATSVAGMVLTAEDELHPDLKRFAASVLMGSRARPKRQGKSKGDPRLRLLQYTFCQMCVTSWEMQLTRTETAATFTACDAVADAFTRAGQHTTYAQMKSLCFDSSYSDLRDLLDLYFIDWLKDQPKSPSE